MAFYHGLRNTLVTKTLKDATAVAYQGGKCVWRVVTLTGELIDTSGTMSGGGKKVRRGAMRSAAAVDVSDVDMADAERRLQQGQTRLLECRNMATLLKTEVRAWCR